MKLFIKMSMFVIGLILGSIGFMMVFVGAFGYSSMIMASGLAGMFVGVYLTVKGME